MRPAQLAGLLGAGDGRDGADVGEVGRGQLHHVPVPVEVEVHPQGVGEQAQVAQADLRAAEGVRVAQQPVGHHVFGEHRFTERGGQDAVDDPGIVGGGVVVVQVDLVRPGLGLHPGGGLAQPGQHRGIQDVVRDEVAVDRVALQDFGGDHRGAAPCRDGHGGWTLEANMAVAVCVLRRGAQRDARVARGDRFTAEFRRFPSARSRCVRACGTGTSSGRGGRRSAPARRRSPGRGR